MRFKGQAIPAPSPGIRIAGSSIVVPDQSLGLAEILTRFTRGESLPVGLGSFAGGEEQDIDNPLNIDLEKLRFADLTEKDEIRKQTEDYVKRYQDQEKAKAASAAAKKAAEAEEAFKKKVAEEAEKLAASRKKD